MKYVIYIEDGEGAGTYVSFYDPTAFDGEGDVAGVADPSGALQFDTLRDAITFYRQEAGVRADGKPNRPLTASAVSFLPLFAGSSN